MFPFRIILCASLFFATFLDSLSGSKPADSVRFNIFDSNLYSFEISLHAHISNSETKFKNGKNQEDKEGYFSQPITMALTNIAKMLDDKNGDSWRAAFLTATAQADGRPNAIAVDYVTEAKKRIGELQTDFSRFMSSKGQVSLKQQFATEILSILSDSLLQFSKLPSFFRDHALISSPLLIELALVAELFDPISKGLGIDDDVKKYRLPCLAYDTLFEYREFAVDARLDKLQVMFVRDGNEKHKINTNDLKDIAKQGAEFTVFAKK